MVKKTLNIAKKPPRPEEVDKDTQIFTVDLPHEYQVSCVGRDEYELCLRNAKPYMEAEEIPEDYAMLIQMQINNYLNVYRLQKSLSDPSYTDNLPARDLHNLQVDLNKAQATIQANAIKLDPLKRKRLVEGMDMADFLEGLKQETANYAKDHIGEFTWMCPHCNGVCLMEVPHFAFDSAAGTKVIFNQEVFELIRKGNIPNDPELEHKYEGWLSVKDAAKILKISPIGILAIALPEEKAFDLGIEYDLDSPESIAEVLKGG